MEQKFSFEEAIVIMNIIEKYEIAMLYKAFLGVETENELISRMLAAQNSLRARGIVSLGANFDYSIQCLNLRSIIDRMSGAEEVITINISKDKKFYTNTLYFSSERDPVVQETKERFLIQWHDNLSITHWLRQLKEIIEKEFMINCNTVGDNINAIKEKDFEYAINIEIQNKGNERVKMGVIGNRAECYVVKEFPNGKGEVREYSINEMITELSVRYESRVE